MKYLNRITCGTLYYQYYSKSNIQIDSNRRKYCLWFCIKICISLWSTYSSLKGKPLKQILTNCVLMLNVFIATNILHLCRSVCI